MGPPLFSPRSCSPAPDSLAPLHPTPSRLAPSRSFVVSTAAYRSASTAGSLAIALPNVPSPLLLRLRLRQQEEEPLELGPTFRRAWHRWRFATSAARPTTRRSAAGSAAPGSRSRRALCAARPAISRASAPRTITASTRTAADAGSAAPSTITRATADPHRPKVRRPPLSNLQTNPTPMCNRNPPSPNPIHALNLAYPRSSPILPAFVANRP